MFILVVNIQANYVKQNGSHGNHLKAPNEPMAVTVTVHVPPATSYKHPWFIIMIINAIMINISAF